MTRSLLFHFTSADIDFLISSAQPEMSDRNRFRRLLMEDERFRDSTLSEERVFRDLVSKEENFVRISPRLYFEILLRHVKKKLEMAGHTIEAAGVHKVAVFDVGEVKSLLSREDALLYLADMLNSFTRISSYTVSYRVKSGIWRKIRFNDMDLDSLISMYEYSDDEQRFGFLKRIADICLFLPAMFPEYVSYSYRYPHSGQLRPSIPGTFRKDAEEYGEIGRKFYRLAAEHPFSEGLGRVLLLLHESFQAAQKPINYLSERYLSYNRQNLFKLEA